MRIDELQESDPQEQVLLENEQDILEEAANGEWSTPVTAEVLFAELGI
jgi:hypothetical protein